MLCCQARSGLIKWVIVLDRLCVLCRTAWEGEQGAHAGLSCEGGTLRARRTPADPAVGDDDDDWDDVCC